MNRCIDLARLGAGNTAPNPMVGAVLVHEGRIIGEGYHRQFGHEHAEVNCIRSVGAEDLHLLPDSTLYVSLEPCAHHGKTPPCTDLIISKKIPEVVIGSKDPFEKVNGKGIDLLRKAGIKVTVGVLQKESDALNVRFFTYHKKKRPYILLKWAQTFNGVIGTAGERMAISNAFSNRLVHRWRMEEAAIMVGTNTALNDDPMLTNRYWPTSNNRQPTRILIDLELRLPSTLHLFDGLVPTIIFNYHKEEKQGLIHFVRVAANKDLLQQLTSRMYELQLQSVLIEGGRKLLQSFIDKDLWDEAHIITSNRYYPYSERDQVITAPIFKTAQLTGTDSIAGDTIQYFINPKT